MSYDPSLHPRGANPANAGQYSTKAHAESDTLLTTAPGTEADLDISHTHADGTLIDGTSRGDGTATILKAHRWRWGRSIASWYLPQSRDKPAKQAIIDAAAAALRKAGSTVTVQIDNTWRPTADVEADKSRSADDRAIALVTRAP